jgi:hypothetical protein
VHPEALRGWIRQDEADRGERDDRLTTDEREELAVCARRTPSSGGRTVTLSIGRDAGTAGHAVHPRKDVSRGTQHRGLAEVFVGEAPEQVRAHVPVSTG